MFPSVICLLKFPPDISIKSPSQKSDELYYTFYYGQNVFCTFTSEIKDYYYYYYYYTTFVQHESNACVNKLIDLRGLNIFPLDE